MSLHPCQDPPILTSSVLFSLLTPAGPATLSIAVPMEHRPDYGSLFLRLPREVMPAVADEYNAGQNAVPSLKLMVQGLNDTHATCKLRGVKRISADDYSSTWQAASQRQMVLGQSAENAQPMVIPPYEWRSEEPELFFALQVAPSPESLAELQVPGKGLIGMGSQIPELYSGDEPVEFVSLFEPSFFPTAEREAGNGKGNEAKIFFAEFRTFRPWHGLTKRRLPAFFFRLLLLAYLSKSYESPDGANCFMMDVDTDAAAGVAEVADGGFKFFQEFAEALIPAGQNYEFGCLMSVGENLDIALMKSRFEVLRQRAPFLRARFFRLPRVPGKAIGQAQPKVGE